jgi:phenylpyruvate tautomerase PptA (4-oxalocrotonate tautomerase family)
MPRARCTFRQRDVTAALKAAVAAGVPVRGVKISPEGAIEVVIGQLPTQDLTTADDELDRWRKEKARPCELT